MVRDLNLWLRVTCYMYVNTYHWALSAEWMCVFWIRLTRPAGTLYIIPDKTVDTLLYGGEETRQSITTRRELIVTKWYKYIWIFCCVHNLARMSRANVSQFSTFRQHRHCVSVKSGARDLPSGVYTRYPGISYNT